jgi:O-antigen/teichoic acid export membrane protein
MVAFFKVRSVTLLRSLERYTKTDMVYLAKGGSWMIAGQIVTGMVAFGLAVAFANLIPRETFGNYKYVLSLGGVLGALTLSGLGTYVTQSVGRGFEGSLRYSFKLSLMWCAPLVLVALAGATYYGLNNNAFLALSLVIIALAAPFMNSAQLYSSYLAGKKDFRLASACNAGISLLQAGALLTGLLFQISVLWLVVIYFAANTLATLICYVLTLHLYSPNGLYNKAMAEFSTRLSFAGVVAAFVGQLDKILIFHFLGAAPVAVYALAQAPVVQMRAALKLATPLSLPKLAALDSRTVAKTLEDKLNRFTLVIFAMIVLYIAIAPTLFHLFFPAYLDAIPYSQGYALLLLLFPKKLVSLALYAQEHMRGQYLLALSTPTAHVILLLALVPSFGLWGVVVAEIGANLAANTLANYYFNQFKKSV